MVSLCLAHSSPSLGPTQRATPTAQPASLQSAAAVSQQPPDAMAGALPGAGLADAPAAATPAEARPAPLFIQVRHRCRQGAAGSGLQGFPLTQPQA